MIPCSIKTSGLPDKSLQDTEREIMTDKLWRLTWREGAVRMTAWFNTLEDAVKKYERDLCGTGVQYFEVEAFSVERAAELVTQNGRGE